MTYASVNGLQLYYETHGTGRPLVLLHGGLMTIDLNFGALLEPLAASRQVIAVELQGARRAGLGHGARVSRPDRRAAITASADHADLRRP
jgi:pimeloyl-ACP methyl ester carboxylesterase